jgi:hypothetical protein
VSLTAQVIVADQGSRDFVELGADELGERVGRELLHQDGIGDPVPANITLIEVRRQARLVGLGRSCAGNGVK